MALSADLISQFVKATNDETPKQTETTVYGTVVIDSGKAYVQIDGSTLYTPISTTTDVKDGDRVTVLIKDHTAVVTGNMSAPSLNKDTKLENGDGTSTSISEFGIVVADKVNTGALKAETARIDKLYTNVLEVEEVEVNGELVAKSAKIENLEAKNAEFDKVTTDILEVTFVEVDGQVVAKSAKIESLEVVDAEFRTLKSDYGEFKQLTTDNLYAEDGTFKGLTTKDLYAEDGTIKYANIDFSNIGEAAMKYLYAESGLIKDVVISNGTITGEIVGVTLKGDRIEGGTVVADKLVIRGEDGLYYKLNYDGETVEAEQTDQNSLNGSVITAKSITATKISVDDLVAFDATIGGFNLTSESIYSGVKESADNTTRGIYLDTDGQVSFGDATNFVKFYRETAVDEEGVEHDTYRLEVSASSILFRNSKNIETAFDEVDDKIATTQENLTTEIEDQKTDYQNFLAKFSKYIRFMEDENGNPSDTAIVIGSGDSAITLELDNESGIVFKKNGVQFGWWDGVDFHTGNIVVEVEERAQFGNFAFVPRSDGSLSFLKVGG